MKESRYNKFLFFDHTKHEEELKELHQDFSMASKKTPPMLRAFRGSNLVFSIYGREANSEEDFLESLLEMVSTILTCKITGFILGFDYSIQQTPSSDPEDAYAMILTSVTGHIEKLTPYRKTEDEFHWHEQLKSDPSLILIDNRIIHICFYSFMTNRLFDLKPSHVFKFLESAGHTVDVYKPYSIETIDVLRKMNKLSM